MLLYASPAPNGAIVVVEDEVAHVSDDGGRTYHVLHRAPESIFHAAIGADGTLFALRGNFLDVVRRGTTTSHAVNDARRVVAAGRVVAVLRNASVDVSTDGGATFTTRALPNPCASCDPTLQGSFDFTIASGSPFVVETSINTCTSADILEWQRLIQIGAPTFQRSLSVPKADYAASWQFGAFGWMYGVSYANRILAVSAAGAVPVDGIGPTAATDRLTVAHNDRVTVATLGDALVEMNGAHAHVLDAHTKPADQIVVDGDDRPLVTDGKELWRFSRITGWSKLALP